MDCILTYKGKDYTEKEFKKTYFERIHTEVFKEGKVKEDYVYDGDNVRVIPRNRNGEIKSERLVKSILHDELFNNVYNIQSTNDIYTAIKNLDEKEADAFIEKRIQESKENGESEKELLRSEYKRSVFERDRNGEPLLSKENITDGKVEYSIKRIDGNKIVLGNYTFGQFTIDPVFKTMAFELSDQKMKEDFNHKFRQEKEKNIQSKRNRLTDIFKRNGIKVSFEENLYLDVNAKIKEVDGNNITIEVNPDRLQNDTEVHEFAHIYVDLLGEENKLYQQAVNQIRDTPYWNNLKKNNKDKPDSWIDKEAVVTAIGLEGTSILEGNELNTFQRLLERVWNTIADILGIKSDYVKRIAKELVDGKFQSDLKGTVLSGWEQRESVLEKFFSRENQNKITVDDVKNVYNTPDGELGRLTQFVHKEFSHTPTTEDMAESQASYKFSNGISITKTDGTTKTSNEIYEEELVALKQYSAEGKYGHLILQTALAKTDEERMEIHNNYEKLLKDKTHAEINKKKFWFLFDKNGRTDRKVVAMILKKMGINILGEKDGPMETQDKYISEGKFYNKKFGLGRTIDLAVEKPNGDLVFADFKFWKSFKSGVFFNVLKWGANKPDLMIDDNMGRASLEMVLSMLMYKEMNPDARWSDVVIGHVNGQSLVDVYSVNIRDNLSMLRDFYKDTNPTLFKELNERKLFDVKEYGGIKHTILDLDNNESKMPVDDLKVIYENRIIDLRNEMIDKKITSITSGKTYYDEEKKITYAEELNRRLTVYEDLKGIKSLADAEEKDMSWWKKWLGTKYDVRSKRLISIKNLYDEKKTNLDAEKKKAIDEFDKYLKVYLDKGNKQNWLQKKGIISNNISQLFSRFLTDKHIVDKDGNEKVGTYLVTKDDPNYVKNKEEQDLVEFMRSNMAKVYHEIMHMPVISAEHGKMVERWQKMGLPEELPDDFFPIIQASQDELRERMGIFTKDTVDNTVRRMMTIFLDTQGYDQNIQRGKLNLNGIGPAVEKLRLTKNHTLSIEKAYKEFIVNLLELKHMYPVVEIGEAVKTYYDSQYLSDLKTPMYENNAAWVESMIDQIVLHNSGKEIKFSTKPISFTWNLPFGFEKGTRLYVKPDKFIMALKNFTSFTFMAVNITGAAFNAVLNILLNHMEGLKGSIASIWMDDNDVDLTLGNLLKADLEVFKLIGYAVVGRLDKSKLYNLAKKFDYLTNNYDFRVRKEQYLAPKNKLWDTSLFYSFYKMSEDFSTYGILAGQLMSVTNKKTGKTLWDSYDTDGNWIGGIRGKVLVFEDAKGNKQYKDLTELDYKEITHLKRVSNRIWGNYRLDERVMAEQYSIGRLLLQFKKWLPAVMNTIYQGRFEDTSLGTYKITGQQEVDGQMVDVYEFTNRIHEGRMWVMLKALYYNSVGRIHATAKADEYRIETMSNENRQHLINFALTIITMLGFVMASGQFWPDDEEKDTYFNKRLRRLFYEDFAQGWNPWDMLKSGTVNQLQGINRFLQLLTGFKDAMFHGLVQGERLQDGRVPGMSMMWRNMPFASVAYSWSRYLGEDMEDNPFIQALDVVGLTPDKALLPRGK